MSLIIKYGSLNHSSDKDNDYQMMGKYFVYPKLLEDVELNLDSINKDLIYDNIYSSPALPCIQTAEVIKSKIKNPMKIRIMDELRNVWHDFGRLIDGRSIELARRKFYSDLISSELLEGYEQIINRVKEIVKRAKNENSIFVTHGIMLSLIQYEKEIGFNGIDDYRILDFIDTTKEISSKCICFEI